MCFLTQDSSKKRTSSYENLFEVMVKTDFQQKINKNLYAHLLEQKLFQREEPN